MVFYAALFLLLVTILVLLGNIHYFCLLEATDSYGAMLLLNDSVGLSDIITAVFRGRIKIHFNEAMDKDISIPCQEYKAADTFHSPDSFTQDWGEVTDAALSSTREVLQKFEQIRGPNEEGRLCLFVQSVILSTYLRLFFRLPITSKSTEDAVWIASNTWRTGDCWRGPIEHSSELHRLVKPSPNPSGVFALLLATQRLIVATICTLEHRGENLQFLRHAGTLLRHPTAPEPGVTRLVEEVIQSHPPIQSVHGELSLKFLPLHWTRSVNFIIPVDSLPPSTCVLTPDGTCHSWLHKAGLPGPPACGGHKWLTHTTTIILSAIETEMRKGRFIIDGDEYGPEDWEGWVLRKLRVG